MRKHIIPIILFIFIVYVIAKPSNQDTVILSISTTIMAIFTYYLAVHTNKANELNREINRLATCSYIGCNVEYNVQDHYAKLILSVYGNYPAVDIEINVFGINETIDNNEKNEVLEDKIKYNIIPSGHKAEPSLKVHSFSLENIYIILQYRDIINNNYVNIYQAIQSAQRQENYYCKKLFPKHLKPMERIQLDEKKGFVSEKGKVIKGIPDDIKKIFAFENLKITKEFKEEDIIDIGKITKIS